MAPIEKGCPWWGGGGFTPLELPVALAVPWQVMASPAGGELFVEDRAVYRRPHSRGFTLLEILVAIVLFLIGAISVARLQNWSVRGTTFGKEALVATTAAQTLAEQLKEQAVQGNFATVLAGGGPSPVTYNPVMTPASIQAGTAGTQAVPGMTIQWAAGNTIGAVGCRYTTVTVTVQWAQNTGNYVVSTVISEL